MYNQSQGYADSLNDFFIRSTRELLSGEGNQVCSPLNVYMALAMLAECTDGNSRQQILDLLNTSSLTALRAQVNRVWNANYWDDGVTTSLLANSLWLDEAYSFHDQTVQALAQRYYASVFHGDLGTEDMNEQLRAWVNSQTGGLLEDQLKKEEMDPSTVFSLVSTVLFTAKWDHQFSQRNTTADTFHSPNGDYSTSFMHGYQHLYYYWGDNFGAVAIPLKDYGTMWMFLPNEGYAPQDLLNNGDWLACIQSHTYKDDSGNEVESWENIKYVRADLGIPKFDIASQNDLKDHLKNLGVSDIFDPAISVFSPIHSVLPLYASDIAHAARVAIDEEGVTAAAYTVIELDGSGGAFETIEFTLDRPFFFVITSPDQLPLFTGIVNAP